MKKSPAQLPAARARLSTVLRAASEVVSIDIVAKSLALDRDAAAKLLSRWRQQGWLRRIGPGIYVPVPLDLAGSEQVVEDPWVLVPRLFERCYVGGWTAAHHWDLTEQLFNEIAAAFLEDKAVVEGQQARLVERGEQDLVDIATDAARLHMRRTVDRLLAEDAQSLAAE